MPIGAIVGGVRIAFYANEHPPAQLHATIAEHRAVFDIVSLEIIAGSLPTRTRKEVREWAFPRKAILLERFATAHERVGPIE